MIRAALLLLCACNQVYSLDETQARTDARALACPPIGETPQFESGLRYVFSRNCINYSFLPPYGTAIAICFETSLQVTVEIGTAGADDLAATSLPAVPLMDRHIARLGHDGEHLYAQAATKMLVFRRAGTDWVYEEDLPRFAANFDTLAPIVNDNGRDRAVVGVEDGTKLVELVRDSTWTEVAVHPAAELGTTVMRQITITSDGLRIIYVGDDATYFSDRPRLDAPFRPGTKLTGLARNVEAFMTDDCARVYVAGVGSVFYAEQLGP